MKAWNIHEKLYDETNYSRWVVINEPTQEEKDKYQVTNNDVYFDGAIYENSGVWEKL